MNKPVDAVRNKIEEHFIMLESAIEVADFEWMQTGIARLSRYYSSLTEEELNKFQEYELIIETGSVSSVFADIDDDNYYEPTEYDEWQDYDPDC